MPLSAEFSPGSVASSVCGLLTAQRIPNSRSIVAISSSKTYIVGQLHGSPMSSSRSIRGFFQQLGQSEAAYSECCVLYTREYTQWRNASHHLEIQKCTIRFDNRVHKQLRSLCDIGLRCVCSKKEPSYAIFDVDTTMSTMGVAEKDLSAAVVSLYTQSLLRGRDTHNGSSRRSYPSILGRVRSCNDQRLI
jgi:hypothetical protein